MNSEGDISDKQKDSKHKLAHSPYKKYNEVDCGSFTSAISYIHQITFNVLITINAFRCLLKNGNVDVYI